MKEQTNRHYYLLNVPFILGLIALLINDHLLKELYGNWFTGKLSDFAGVLILPLFIKYTFRTSHRSAIVWTAVLFAFWNSSCSQVFIDWINSWSPLNIGRVVDYTDLVAMLSLAFSYHVMKNINRYAIRINKSKWITNGFFFISLFAFVATSAPFDDPIPQSSLRYCCDMVPTDTTVGAGKIYIPNIFTPDGDGINDLFIVDINSGIAKIDTILIYAHEQPRTLFAEDSLRLVFSRFDITDVTVSGWDGRAFGQIIPERYFYRIVVESTDGIRESFEGYLCSVPCTEPIFQEDPLFLDNCGFSTQYNTATESFDKDAPTLELLDCFE